MSDCRAWRQSGERPIELVSISIFAVTGVVRPTIYDRI